MGACSSCCRGPSPLLPSIRDPPAHPLTASPPPPAGSTKSAPYEPLLLDNEREAVADLLQYLENRQDTNFFTGEPLGALSTLSYSDNVDLQRSAALAFAEITEKDVREVSRETLEPILFLLNSHDVEVQRAASAALGNLAVNGPSSFLPPSLSLSLSLSRGPQSSN